MSEINFSLAKPNALPLRMIHTEFQKKLQKSLINQLDILETGTSLAMPILKQKLTEINTGIRFKPDIYAAHWGLNKSINSNRIDDCVHHLKILADLLRDGIYASDGYQIHKVSEDLVDNTMREYLASEDGPRGQNGELPEMNIPNEVVFCEQKTNVEKSLEILRSVDADMYAEFMQYTIAVKLFSGLVARGMTSVRAFGQIYMRFPDPDEMEHAVPYYVSHLTHEISHLHLHAIMAFDPLVINPDHERFPAPIRIDLRPIHGIYHASFVLSRMVRVFRRWGKVDSSSHIRSELEMYRGMLKKGLDVLYAHGQFTENGRILLKAVSSVAEED